MKAIIINNMTAGGAEKVVLTLLSQFHDNGEQFILICLGREQFYQLPEKQEVHYLTDLEDLPNGISKVYYLFKCAFSLKRIVKEKGIKLVQGHLISANFVCAIAKSLGMDATLQLVHHCQVNFDKRNSLVKAFAKYWYRWMFMKIDTIITISKVMKHDLETYLNIENHPHHVVINNPHPINEIQTLSKEKVDDFHFDKDKKYLITVSRIHERKRIETILEAYDQLKNDYHNLELLIVGDGPLKTHYEEMAQNMGLTKGVHFLGYRTNPFKYMSKVDLFLMSSRMEGLPNIIIESMICGTPVISSDCISGPREILNPDSDLSSLLKDTIEYGKYGVLFPIGRADLLVEATKKCLDDPTLLNQYRTRIKTRINSYDSNIIIKKYLATFPKQRPKKEDSAKVEPSPLSP